MGPGRDKSRLLCVMQLPPPIHGVTAVNQQVASSAVLAARFELDIVPLRFAETVDELGRVTVHKASRAVATAVRLAWRLLAHRPDATYLTLTPHGPAFYRDCVFVGIIKSFGVPRIFHLHSQGVADQLDAGWKHALYAWAFRDAHVIHLAAVLARDTASVVDGDRVGIVANGVPDHAIGIRAARTIPRVLFLSNMIAEKGPLILLEALGMLAARGVELEATFAGAPSDALEPFGARVRQLGLADRVRYIGPVVGDAKVALFRDHDIFALPTSRDAFPLVVLEAMQHGLPVVSTRVGAIPEIVREGTDGFLVPAGEVSALAERLHQLIVDAPLRASIGQHARARYLERYTLDHFEHGLRDVLARWVDHA